MVNSARPSSLELVLVAPSKRKKTVPKTARMSTGGKKPICDRQPVVVTGQQVLHFPTKEALVQQGRDTILARLRVLRRPLCSYKLGTAQKYMNNGIDMTYTPASWIEHPNADFKRDAVSTFLNDVRLSDHSEAFISMGVVSGDDLLHLSLEMCTQTRCLILKEALGLEGAEWIRVKAVLMNFACPVIWVLD